MKFQRSKIVFNAKYTVKPFSLILCKCLNDERPLLSDQAASSLSGRVAQRATGDGFALEHLFSAACQHHGGGL